MYPENKTRYLYGPSNIRIPETRVITETIRSGQTFRSVSFGNRFTDCIPFSVITIINFITRNLQEDKNFTD